MQKSFFQKIALQTNMMYSAVLKHIPILKHITLHHKTLAILNL